MDGGVVIAFGTTSVVLLGAFGGAVKWMVARVDAREGQLATAQAAFSEKMDKRHRKVEDNYRRLFMAFQIVCAELRKLDPGSTALDRANQILTAATPLEFTIPDDMLEILGGLR